MSIAKNLIAFSFNQDVNKDLLRLESLLGEHALREPGAGEAETIGFVSPVSQDSDILARKVGNYTVLAVGKRTKIVPASVLRDKVMTKAKEIAAKRGSAVGAKERKALRDDILADMLSRAFVKFSSTQAWIDHKNGWLLVDTASRAVAEMVVSTLREALGSFPAQPILPEESPRVLMTEWLSSGDLPDGFALGDECELRDPATTTGARWKGVKVDLDSEEVREHLRNGMQPFLLGLGVDGRVSFVLDETLTLRKLNFGDAVLDGTSDSAQDALGEFDANFTVIGAEVSALLRQLSQVFTFVEAA